MNQAFSIRPTAPLTVTYRPVGNLIPDPRNARTHPKRQIEQLKASIQEFGFTIPILVDPEGHIIAGHGRLKAAKALGLAEILTVTLSGLSDAQMRALRIADNKIALNAGWDLEILQQELSELASIDLDIDAKRSGRETGSRTYQKVSTVSQPICMNQAISILPTAPLTITYRALSDLIPDPRNARTHAKRQIEQLRASIQEFGFTNPILVDPEGHIIAGHGRLKAAKALGLAEVPTVVLSGLSDAQKRTLRIADNKIALNAGWDLEILQQELSELASIDLDIDATLTGFSTGEIDVILAQSADPDDEVIPPVPVAPRTKPGDIWILGNHRVGCGDSRDAEFLRRVIGDDAHIDAAFLDPPYNVRIEGNASPTGRHGEFAMASGEMSETEFRAFLNDALGAAARVSRDGAVHFVCMDWRHMDSVSVVGSKVYGDLLNLCIWNKSNGGMGSLYRSKHELVFVYRVGTTPHLNMVELGKHGRNRTNVWDYASVNSMRGNRREDLALHPTVKPTAMVADAIKDVTRHGDLVLDLFLGSGTTLLAAERTGRRFRGLEIDPKYVDVALERWSSLTGLEPSLEGAAA